MTLDFHTTLLSNGTVVDSPEEVRVLETLGDVPQADIIDGLWEVGDEGWLVCWAGMDAPSVLLRAERCTVLVAGDGDGDGEVGTRYASYETYYGPLATVLQATTEDALVEKFGEWARGLKGYVEGVASC
ncbi:hypothetical protein B7494_g8229 [Chlorociboria aeruginascens]|nr:hypothetical protein B7494_g8229 [Chlorociboria aeruginascens]